MDNRINFTQEQNIPEPWLRVGVGFSTKKGTGFNIIIGNKMPKEQGSKEMVEQVQELNLRPGDELYLGEVTDRDGNKVKTKNGAQVYKLQLKPEREPEEVKDEQDE